ncbi:MAG: MFS transporter, partial [Acidobacteria bacterium]|nr:MFS transporter [Acidobacteriota bacterium]
VIIIFVKEQRHKASAEPPKFKLSLAGFDSNFKRFLFVIALFTLSNSSDAFLLLRAKDAGIETAYIPLLWVALHISKVATSVVGGGMSDRFGRKTFIVSGWLVYALVYAGFAFVSSPWQCWTLFIIYGAYFGLSEGVEKAFVADMVPKGKAGTAYGLYNLAFGITVFPASLLFGFAWNEFGASIAFIASACVSVIAIGLLLTIRPRTHQAS